MSQRKLLLADDSITIQKVVNLTFADEGIEVITFGDGDSAMEKLAEIAPDLVMADVNMPGLNGYELCEKIRAIESLKNTPVILLVGSFEPFDEEKAKSVGADDFLTKPFQSIRQLVNKVTELLDSARNGETSAAAGDFQEADTLRNFETSQESESTAETSESQNTVSYGDAGMDDEMIETAQPSGFPLDETSKFESRKVSEPEYEAAMKTQPLSAEDVRNFSFSNSSNEDTGGRVNYETVQEVSTENYSIEQPDEIESRSTDSDEAEASATEAETSETIENPSVDIFDLSGDDLLDIPFAEGDEEEEIETAEEPSSDSSAGSESQAQAQPEETETSAPETIEATAYQQPGTAAFSQEIEEVQPDFYQQSESAITSQETEEVNSDVYQQTEAEADEVPAETSPENIENIEITSSTQLSPEMIDAIAQRVVEKLSDKAVKDVAWEVVPQMADLIIKKMAEEKLKE